MKVLVTGGAGYCGVPVLEALQGQGHTVTVLDLFRWGVDPVLHCRAANLIKGDVRDASLVRRTVRDHDVVLHLAAYVGAPICAKYPLDARSTNIDGSRIVAGSISKGQVFVYASTGSTYGKVDGVCTEDTPISPLSLYGETKYEGEKLCRDAGAICLRFATVFGVSPCMRYDLLVNSFVWRAIHHKYLVLFEAGFKRTFLHVSDVARCYEHAVGLLASDPKWRGHVFNVGCNTMNMTKLELAEAVRKIYSMNIIQASVGEDPDKRDYEVSYDKLDATGFKTKVSIEQGIAEVGRVAALTPVHRAWRFEQ